MDGRRGARARLWRALVPVACLLAGFGFAVNVHNASQTSLQVPGETNLAGLVSRAEGQVHALDRQQVALQQQLSAETGRAAKGNSGVAAAQRKVAALAAPGGLTAVAGPGIEVILDDASDTSADAGVDPNELVVHQSDLQAVVNALWAGGAEAMSIAGQRVIATSAVRCVGNTLLLNGNVYSPPFQVAAIGPYRTMLSALNASPGVALFRQAAGYYGLGYTTESQPQLRLPAYRGSVALVYAKAGQ